jgi:hypothetical protein
MGGGSVNRGAPTDEWRIGETVPWVVAWSGEDRFGLGPSPVFPAYRELTQAEAPGVGAPMFRGMHLARQRRGLVNDLCQICGRATPSRDRFIFPTVAGRFFEQPDGSLRYGSNMPPLHLQCAARAQRLCPAVRRARTRPIPLPKAEGELVPQLTLPPGLEDAAPHLPDGVPVVFSYYLIQSLSFTRQIQRLLAKR